MKRFISLCMAIISILSLAGCSGKAMPVGLSIKEGIAPYELTERDSYILNILDMESNSKLINFNAPEEATGLRICVYRLNENQTWDKIGGISAYTDPGTVFEHLSKGTFSISLRDNYSVFLCLNGSCTSQTDETSIDDSMGSVIIFLSDFQEIELNKEIPVGLMLYHNLDYISCFSIQDYFNPKKFEGIILAQAVTVTFTDVK